MGYKLSMLMLLLAAIAEAIWNVALKKSTGLTDWRANGIGLCCMSLGIFLFKKSLDSVSLSVASLVWSAISLSLTIGLDVLFFKTRFDLLTAGFILLSIISIIGLGYSASR
ncbi:MAG: hypothetical protein JSU01_17535 [Bacteroidetes bacterium]|nr:hypothetical protein [Bacteroidota bacterium]